MGWVADTNYLYPARWSWIKKKKKSKGEKTIKRTGMKIEEKKNGGMKPEARLTGEECFSKLCERNKKFNLYQTQLRKAKRILSWVSQMDNKKAKAPTTFQNASLNIIEATENGTQCGGGLISDDVKIANDKLQTCNTTATDMCTSSKIGLNTSLITECIPKLQKFVDDYKVIKSYVKFKIFHKIILDLSAFL